MRKILILTSFILPITILAQTRPMPKKTNEKPVARENIIKAKKPIPFVYMSMDVEEINQKKQEKSFNLKFKSFDVKYSDKIHKSVKHLNSIIDVLNFLGEKRWELVAVENGRYFFKNNNLSSYLNK